MPPSVCCLAGVTYLNLGFNTLTSLPPAMAGLGQLRLLELTQNRLTALPDWCAGAGGGGERTPGALALGLGARGRV